jgi:hypothetical protein
MEDPGGVEPLGARIKSPLPNHLGLERSGSIGDRDTAASRPGFVIVIFMMLSCLLVLPHGNDPRSSGYRPGALLLSYGRMIVLAPGFESGNVGVVDRCLVTWRSELFVGAPGRT